MAFPHSVRAVVTGAGSGLGRAFSLELASRRARLVCADIDLASAERTAEEARAAGADAIAARADVAKPEDVEALAKLADERFGGSDLVVNNAGVAVAGPFSEISLEDWRWIVDINLWGVIHGCRTFVPRFERQGSGFVINVASAAGLLCAPEMAPYNVTKSAVVGLSETLHSELAAKGITVTVLCPTFFRTNIGKAGRGPRKEELAGVTEKLMDKAKIDAAGVARAALDGCERGRVYVVPMADGRWSWRAKRADPELFYRRLMPAAFARLRPRWICPVTGPVVKPGAVSSLRPLLDSRRVILCVGCGGVGKTTTSAALSLAAAMSGKRVLCLTIDPAHRLAQSLGLREMTSEAQRIDPERFRAAGLDVRGELTVMMLDTKRTFDELVVRHASSPEARDRILSNQLYRYVSTSLAGTQEYMAMEKLYALEKDPSWDLIVLDTPPTANALDFLDAPERLVDALDSAVMRWFLQAFQASGKLSLNLLARSTAVVLKGISRLTGGGFLEAMAEFVVELNDLFGGFKARAAEVSRALRGPQVGYVLVTSPDPMSIREVLYFAERLEQQGMRRDAFVVNRVHPRAPDAPPVEAIARALADRGLGLDEDAPERVAAAARDEARQGELDARHVASLDAARADLRVDVPAYARDVHDLTALAEVARVLAG